MYERDEQRALLEVARASLGHGLRAGEAPRIDPLGFTPPLREKRASFVTLRLAGRLRGCIGQLQARDPLVEGVACNAFAAGFRDPRFAPLADAELDAVLIDVSVLGTAEPLDFDTREQLLAQLRPHRDGLIVRDGACSATFLPAVWETLPEPERFLGELLRKAKLDPERFPASLQALRYRTETFGEAEFG